MFSERSFPRVRGLFLGMGLMSLFAAPTRLVADDADKLLKAIELVRKRPVVELPTSTPNAQTHVIAIGVEHYLHAPRLSYSGDDAEAWVAAFRQVQKLDEANTLLITDSAAQPLRAKNLVAQLEERLMSLQRDDTLVFHFSGHGFPAADGTMYLCPSDFDAKKPETTGLAVESLRSLLAKCRAETKLVFLDACFSGGFNQRLDGNELANAFKTLKGTATVTSSSNGQPSAESEKLKQGIFTYWLVRSLRGQANTVVDRHIDIAELFRFIKDNVPETALQELKLEQQPTWAFEHLAGIPRVIELKRPDRPSDLIPLKAMPLPPEPDVLQTVLDTISRFPQANPRNGIGLTKWILKHAPPDSAIAQAAQRHLNLVDQMILNGTISLNDGDDNE